MTLYSVYAADETFLMTAPMETIRRVFNLHSSAVERVENELKGALDADAELFFNLRSNVFSTPKVIVRNAK